MTTYTIEFDLKELKNLTEKFAKTIENAPAAALPNTAAAFSQAAKYVHNMWTGYLRGEKPLQGIDFMSGVTSSMVNSIKMRYRGDLHYDIYSDSMQLDKKVKGQKEVEFDMKEKYPYGKHSRVSKKGIPYLIIPFRWGTPNEKGTKRAHFNNFIPQKNYNMSVSGLDISSVKSLKDHFEKNARGEDIARWGYNWVKGSRLSDDDAWEMENKRGNKYSSQGMVRMLDTKKNSTSSTYFTFRIISAKSPADSWIYHRDAIPAVDMMGALERTVLPEVEKFINTGIKADEEAYRNMR